MSLLITIGAFALAIGVLVTVHELGHYWAARLFDVKILRFSVGFGRPLWRRAVGPDQTEWVVAALPLGGFVKMADERDDSVAPEDRARAFNVKPVWQRMVIIAAGPVANFVLAAVFYWLVLVVGQPGALPYVAQPVEGSVAAQAGFSDYDLVVSVDGTPVTTWNDVRMRLLDRASARETARIEVETRAAGRSVRELPTQSLTAADLDRDFAGRLGIVPWRVPIPPVVGEVTPGSAAARAGLKPGDRIVSVHGRPIKQWSELTRAVSPNPGKSITLVVESGGEQFDAVAVPDRVEEAGQVYGRLGVRPRVEGDQGSLPLTQVRYGFVESIPKAIGNVWDMSVFSLRMLWRMITGNVSWKNLSGPITIADYAGQTAKQGLSYYLGFLALVSVSIGVLNLLPIPVLDGGQLLYHVAELIKGSPLSEQAMEIGQRVGLALLLGLTAFAFYNDIYRLVSG